MNENLERLRMIAIDLADLAEKYEKSNPELSAELFTHAGMIRFSIGMILQSSPPVNSKVDFEWMEWK